MTTTTTVATITCPRCHGSGKIPHEITPDQQAVLDQLAEVGKRRAAVLERGAKPNRHSVEGRQLLDKAFEDIRVLTPEAARLGVTREQIADAIGVARQQLHNILTGNTTGRAKTHA